MKLYCHIGCPKTGTASIQQYLNLNRDRLVKDGWFFFGTSLGLVNHHLARLVLFPETESLMKQFTQGGRARGLSPKGLRAELMQKFTEEIAQARQAGCDKVIISDELIYTSQPSDEMFDHIHDFLGQFFDEIEIIWVVRPQPDMYVSQLSTLARSGLPIVPEDIKQHPRPFFEFDRFASKLKSVFPNQITVIKFKQHKNIINDFAQSLGLTTLGEFPPRQNKALDVRMMALLMALKSRLAPPLYKHFASRHVDRFACKMPLSIGLENARTISDAYRESNQGFITQHPCAQNVALEDLIPDVARYDKPANLEMLKMSPEEAMSYLADELADDRSASYQHRKQIEALGILE